MSKARLLWALPLLLFVAACQEGNTAVPPSSAVVAKSMQDTTTYIPRLRNVPRSVMPTDSFYAEIARSGAGGGATVPVIVVDTVPPGAIMDLQ